MELNETTLLHSSERGEIILGTAEDKKQYVRKSGSFDTAVMAKLKDCKSPYLAAVVEYSADYMIMEYVSGEPLNAGNLPKDRLYEIFCEICEGIMALHCAGIIHRDIKPSNIMLTDSGKIKIIDYDAARLKKPEADKDTVFVGTDGFAAPEQYGFMQTDERSDIYALGVTMKLLLGEQYMRSPYKAVAEKCMRFDPQKRYPTVAAVKLAISLVNSRWLLIVSAVIIAFALSLPFMLRGAEKPLTEQETAATTAHTTENTITETAPVITKEISNETTASTTVSSIETTKNTTTTTESKTVDTEKSDENTEETSPAVTTSKTTALPVEVGENTTTVMTEEKAGEDNTKSDDIYEWDTLLVPEEFPRLADYVSSYMFNYESTSYTFEWNDMDDTKAQECFDKISEWLGECRCKEFSLPTMYGYTLEKDRCNVSFQRVPDNDTIKTRVVVSYSVFPPKGLSQIEIPDIKNSDTGGRTMKWEDIDILYDGFPKLTDYITGTSISEYDGTGAIVWDRMSQSEAAAICLKIVQSFKETKKYDIYARDDGFMRYTIEGDGNFMSFTWFSEDWLDQYYQAQLALLF